MAAKLPLSASHQLAKSGKLSEALLLKAFLEAEVFVPSKTDPKTKGILPATVEIEGNTYVLAFDTLGSAGNSMGVKQLKNNFFPRVYGDKFALLVSENVGIAVGTKAGGVFTISPELLANWKSTQE